VFDVLWEERQVWVFTLAALILMQKETVLRLVFYSSEDLMELMALQLCFILKC